MIPINKLDEGVKLSSVNAWSLLEDAEHLQARGSYGHAVTLAAFAFEEFAKMAIYRAMILEGLMTSLSRPC